jgi:hypothetical protein
VSSKIVSPEFTVVILAEPAELPDSKTVDPPELRIVAVPAALVPSNSNVPPPVLLMMALPADPASNTRPTTDVAVLLKVGAFVESLTMPLPLNVNELFDRVNV